MMPYLSFGPHTIRMYVLFNSLAFCAALICNLCFLRRQCRLLCTASPLAGAGSEKWDPMILSLLALFLLTAAQSSLGGAANTLVGNLFTDGTANYFGNILSPLVLMLLFALLRVDPLKQMDLLIPGYASSLVFFKLACLLAGCCNGWEWEHGFYFVSRQRYEFPSQLVEMLLALAIFLVLIWAVRKDRFPGRVHALYLILYSATRFFSEFTREGEIVLWGLQMYHLLCIGGVVIGIIEWLLLTKYGERISRRFAQKPETQ